MAVNFLISYCWASWYQGIIFILNYGLTNPKHSQFLNKFTYSQLCPATHAVCSLKSDHGYKNEQRSGWQLSKIVDKQMLLPCELTCKQLCNGINIENLNLICDKRYSILSLHSRNMKKFYVELCSCTSYSAHFKISVLKYAKIPFSGFYWKSI